MEAKVRRTDTIEERELDAVHVGGRVLGLGDQVDSRSVVERAQSKKTLEKIGGNDLSEDGTVDLCTDQTRYQYRIILSDKQDH